MIVNIAGLQPIVASSVTAYPTAAAAQVVDITVNQGGAAMGGKFFYMYTTDDAGIIGIWFNDTDTGSTQPVMKETSEYLSVSVLAADTAIQVATKLAAVIAGHASYVTATNGVGTLSTVTVTYAAVGSASTPVNGYLTTPKESEVVNPGLVFSITTAGKPATPATLNLFTIVGKIADSSNTTQHPRNQRFMKTRDITITVPYQMITFVTDPV